MPFNSPYDTEEKRIRFFSLLLSSLLYSHLPVFLSHLCFCVQIIRVCSFSGRVGCAGVAETHVKPEFVPESRSSLDQDEPTCFSVSPLGRGNKGQKVFCVYLNAKNTDHTVAAFIAVTQPVQRGLESQWVSWKRLLKVSVSGCKI